MYLTEEDYLTAEANGINRNTAYQRFYIRGWKRERTVTDPVKHPPRLYAKYEKQCKKTGICASTFYRRVRDGMDPKKAATTPPQPFRNRKPGRISAQDFMTAAANGIERETVKARVYQYRWTVAQAITIPTGSKRPNRKRKGA
jgi:hypothetical protein